MNYISFKFFFCTLRSHLPLVGSVKLTFFQNQVWNLLCDKHLMVQKLWACTQAKFIYIAAKHLPLSSQKQLPIVKYNSVSRTRFRFLPPCSLLCRRGTDVFSSWKELPVPHLPSLYFQVMSPKILQSQSARVYYFHDTSPFPQPLNTQDNYSTWHLLTGIDRFTLGFYLGSPYIQHSYHHDGSLWISSPPQPPWDTALTQQLPMPLVCTINKWLLYALWARAEALCSTAWLYSQRLGNNYHPATLDTDKRDAYLANRYYNCCCCRTQWWDFWRKHN